MKKLLLILLLIVGCGFADTIKYKSSLFMKSNKENIIFLGIKDGRVLYKDENGRTESILCKRVIAIFDSLDNKIEFNCNKLDIYNSNNSIGIGLVSTKKFYASNKTPKGIHLSHDMKLSKNFAIYGILSYDNILGIGLAWQSDYNKNGIMLALNSGLDVNKEQFSNFSASYQWRLGTSSYFFSLGISDHSYMGLKDVTPLFFNHPFYPHTYVKSKMSVIKPIISLDKRF